MLAKGFFLKYNWIVIQTNNLCRKDVIFIARRYDKEDAKRRILSVCVRCFIEKGYRAARLADIMQQADVTSSSFHHIFPTKDAVLLELAEFMFDNQFGIASQIVRDATSPIRLYAVETAIQMTLAELNENLREIYVEAYTQPKIAEYIYQKTSTVLQTIFGKYLPDCSEGDFYELEIGSAGIMRAYMARPCDKYFTLSRKLERFLSMSLKVYCVPDDEIEQVLSYLRNTDMVALANQAMQELFAALAMKFDFTLEQTAP